MNTQFKKIIFSRKLLISHVHFLCGHWAQHHRNAHILCMTHTYTHTHIHTYTHTRLIHTCRSQIRSEIRNVRGMSSPLFQNHHQIIKITPGNFCHNPFGSSYKSTMCSVRMKAKKCWRTLDPCDKWVNKPLYSDGMGPLYSVLSQTQFKHSEFRTNS